MQTMNCSVATLIDWENLDTYKGKRRNIDFGKIKVDTLDNFYADR